MEINIPTALEARASVQRGQYDRAKQQIAIVERIIKAAISNGSQYATCDQYLDAAVVAALVAKGYKVAKESDRNETYFQISW